LRELVTNAVMHRNYLLNSYIQICIFDDRVEIVSPGGIFGGLTVEDILGGRSSIRNEVLADAFLKMRLVEHWGSGLKRIRELCTENGIEEPTYTASYSFFTATVKRGGDVQEESAQADDVSPNMLGSSVKKFGEPTKSSVKITELMEKNKEITLDEVASILNLSKRAVEKQVKKLREAGIIERVGSDRSGFWKILDVDR
ncbi:MAG: winged helix-turn-helix transcriptional regulator, partial [Treponema sp.]|nr:winged helix-turn-helix transcriptional regulator [Treponema sp.]